MNTPEVCWVSVGVTHCAGEQRDSFLTSYRCQKLTTNPSVVVSVGFLFVFKYKIDLELPEDSAILTNTVLASE